MPVADCQTGQVREHTADEQAAIQAARASLVSSPVRVDVAAGFVTVTAGAISNVEGFGFSGATRVAVGRVRFFFDTAQLDANYLAQVTVRHTADVMVRINAQTPTYVEVKTNSIEATGYNVEVVRITR